MTDVRFDADQRFTCSQCGDCCRRGWEIAVSGAEVERYRKAGAGRWFRTAVSEGEAGDPFDRAGRDLWRIRKRADGACGFLSPENRCRLHEELGGAQKPLTCRLYPFQFHHAETGAVMTASYACPTIVADEGKPVRGQMTDLLALRAESERGGPARARRVLLTDGRPLAPVTLATLRTAFRTMLDRSADLPTAALRIAAVLDDLTRHRVVRLKNDAFAEYVELTTRHAAEHGSPPVPREPTRFGRVFARGLLFMALAGRLQRREGASLGLRLRLFGLLLHVQGLGPPVEGVDLGRVTGRPAPWADPATGALARRYLGATIETLGTGRLPVAEELGLAAGVLNVAAVLAALPSLPEGAMTDAATFARGLRDAADLTHIEGRGMLGSFLRTFIGGTEALVALAAPRLG